MTDRAPRPRWNHNIHYHRLVLRAVPPGARTALDVGTGDGLLARDLRDTVADVVGLDVDPGVLDRARAADDRIDWRLGDVLTASLEPGSFDLVASVATLHHLPDPHAALTRFAALTAPGGTVVVVGLARTASVLDRFWSLAGAVAHRVLIRRREYWEHFAPTVWPPPHTYDEIRRVAESALPGARWRRLVLWRYAIVWTKPRGERVDRSPGRAARFRPRGPRGARAAAGRRPGP